MAMKIIQIKVKLTYLEMEFEMECSKITAFYYHFFNLGAMNNIFHNINKHKHLVAFWGNLHRNNMTQYCR